LSREVDLNGFDANVLWTGSHVEDVSGAEMKTTALTSEREGNF
jgi:hypothetical protein